MRQNLLETYGKQLKVAEAYVNKNFGKEVSSNTKLTTAVLLDNTNRWITESMNSVATMRSDLGDWKRFCLNLTNIAVPSLIANDLVIVHPMTSYAGSIAYLKYVSKTTKGGVNQGDEFNSVFNLGKMSDGRVNFTSQVIIEQFTGAPVSMDIVEKGMKHENGNMGIVGHNYKLIAADGYFQYSDTLDAKIGPAGDKDVVKVAYVAKLFQMEQVPAEDIPTIGPKMEHIALVAEPRRIAVKYDQITAFQA